MKTFDPKDTILDACLDEVLSSHAPPDLSARILQSLSASGQARNGNGLAQLPSPVQRMADAADSIVSVAPNTRPRSKSKSSWTMAIVIACVLMVGVAVGLVALNLSNNGVDRDGNNIAEKDNAEKDNAEKDNDRDIVKPKPDGENKQPTGDGDQVNPKSNDKPNDKKPSTIEHRDNEFNVLPPFSVAGENKSPKYDPSMRPERPTPSPDEQVIAFINESIQGEWQKHKVVPAERADDSDWCRRVYVRLVGRIPSVDERDEFVSSKDRDKRTKLVDQLLASQEYVQYWSTVWANVLIGRFAGRGRGELANREGLEQYLRDAIQANKPYDQMAYELLTATGSGHPQAADFNGASNFVLAGVDEDAKKITSHVSRIFLGNNLRCVECHDHYVSGAEQKKFWQLNAFFHQLDVQPGSESGARLVNRDAKEDEVFYSQPNGLLKAALPVLPDGTPIPSDGALAEVDRRSELAGWIVRSDSLSRSLVNRMWSQLFHYGFTSQVDDMDQHAAPSHPELLHHLSNEFVAHDYDMKSLMRWMALSDAFSLSSDMPAGQLVDAPETGKQPLFSRYYMRKLEPEAVYNSLLAVSKQFENSSGDAAKIRDDFFQQFSANKVNGLVVDPHIRPIDSNPSIPHGPLTQKFLTEDHDVFLQQVAKSDKMSDAEKVEHLFLTALSREPRHDEIKLAEKLYAANQGNTYAVLEIIWWAIINSNEFILDH